MNIEQEPTGEIILDIRNLSKTFGDFKALADLSLQIKKGEIYGLIGPNGAGKTTLINCILNLLNTDKDSDIRIFDQQVPKQMKNIYPRLGYMPQELALYEDIEIRQNLEYFGKMYGLKNAKLQKKIDEVLKLVNLLPFKTRIINNCSGGMKRRCSLAAALLCEPDLLILDEPTVGIDPSLRMEFWNYFETLAKKGITILITTHYLQESVKCSNVGLIWKKIIKSGPPQGLREEVMNEKNLAELPDMEEVFIHFTKEISEGGAI